MVASEKVLRSGPRERLRTELGLEQGWEVRASIREERNEAGLADPMTWDPRGLLVKPAGSPVA